MFLRIVRRFLRHQVGGVAQEDLQPAKEIRAVLVARCLPIQLQHPVLRDVPEIENPFGKEPAGLAVGAVAFQSGRVAADIQRLVRAASHGRARAEDEMVRGVRHVAARPRQDPTLIFTLAVKIAGVRHCGRNQLQTVNLRLHRSAKQHCDDDGVNLFHNSTFCLLHSACRTRHHFCYIRKEKIPFDVCVFVKNNCLFFVMRM